MECATRFETERFVNLKSQKAYITAYNSHQSGFGETPRRRLWGINFVSVPMTRHKLWYPYDCRVFGFMVERWVSKGWMGCRDPECWKAKSWLSSCKCTHHSAEDQDDHEVTCALRGNNTCLRPREAYLSRGTEFELLTRWITWIYLPQHRVPPQESRDPRYVENPYLGNSRICQLPLAELRDCLRHHLE